MFLLIFSKSMLGIVLILANHGPLRVTQWHFASEIWYVRKRICER